MTEFNSNLNNLFKNYQQQQQYAKEKFDVNGDGKINSKDKTQLTKNEKELLKNEKLFDFNGDGKLDQSDVDLFLKGDVDGDGKITKEEMNFISKYKSNMKTAFQKSKADFELDGKKYANGKLATGVIDGKYYKNGILSNGTIKNGNTTSVYKKGELQYSVTDNNKGSYPNLSGSSIKFNSKQKLTLSTGDKAVINKDGTVEVLTEKGAYAKFNKDGGLMFVIGDMNDGVSSKVKIKPNEIKNVSYQGKTYAVKNTGKSDSNVIFGYDSSSGKITIIGQNISILDADKNDDNLVLIGNDISFDGVSGNDNVTLVAGSGNFNLKGGDGNNNSYVAFNFSISDQFFE